MKTRSFCLGAAAVLAGAFAVRAYYAKECEPKRVPPLRKDPIPHLSPSEAGAFVEEQLFPRSREILAALDAADRRSASLLLTSLTRFLVEAAPEEEKNLPSLLELLDCCKRSYRFRQNEKDPVARVMKEHIERERGCGHLREERSLMQSYMDYLRFRLTCKRQRRVIESCRVMVYDLTAALNLQR